MKIQGIPVVLLKKTSNSTDPFGHPIFSEEEVVVENVLVAPTSSDDVINQQELTGRKAVYTLAIPKGDTNVWEDQKVKFFGETWRVFGQPLEGLDHLIPLSWNKKVMVERYE